MFLSELRQRLKTVLTITETSDVARRYFSLQSFDGVMVGIGVIFGLHLSGAHTLRVIAQTVISVMIAMTVSGVTGALISEKSEQEARIKRLEEATLREMRNTLHARVGSVAIVIVALINGLSPVSAVFAVALPYLLVVNFGLERFYGLVGALLVATIILLAAGTVVGRSTRIGGLKAAAQMIAAGMVTAFLIIILESLL